MSEGRPALLTGHVTLFRALACLCALAILVLSLQPFSGPVSQTQADKVQHFVAYAGLAGLMMMGWRRWSPVRVVLIATLFGAGIEVAQGLLSDSRTASLWDGIANLMGAGFAVIVLLFIRKIMAKSS